MTKHYREIRQAHELGSVERRRGNAIHCAALHSEALDNLSACRQSSELYGLHTQKRRAEYHKRADYWASATRLWAACAETRAPVTFKRIGRVII